MIEFYIFLLLVIEVTLNNAEVTVLRYVTVFVEVIQLLIPLNALFPYIEALIVKDKTLLRQRATLRFTPSRFANLPTKTFTRASDQHNCFTGNRILGTKRLSRF